MSFKIPISPLEKILKSLEKSLKATIEPIKRN